MRLWKEAMEFGHQMQAANAGLPGHGTRVGTGRAQGPRLGAPPNLPGAGK
jgi:hypothetical protein